MAVEAEEYAMNPMVEENLRRAREAGKYDYAVHLTAKENLRIQQENQQRKAEGKPPIPALPDPRLAGGAS